MKNYRMACHQADGHSLPQLVLETSSATHSNYSQICPTCNRDVILIDINMACQIIGKTRKTIYTWIKKGLITTVYLADSRQLIIYSSLFLPKQE
jgi:hypothetical protein